MKLRDQIAETLYIQYLISMGATPINTKKYADLPDETKERWLKRADEILVLIPEITAEFMREIFLNSPCSGLDNKRWKYQADAINKKVRGE